MSIFLQPGRFATSNFSGALVAFAAGAPTALNPLEWDSEVYDTAGWHSNASSRQRLTVPAGITAIRATFNLLTTSTADITAYVLKNGGTFRGIGAVDASTAGNDAGGATTAIVEVVSGDYFTATEELSNSPSVDPLTWISIEAVDPTLRRALVFLSVSQFISAGVTTTLPWSGEVYDIGGWHDMVADSHLLTVPPGVSRVRVLANLSTSSISGQAQMTFQKNGASARGVAAKDCDTAGNENLNAASAVLLVSPGDSFEVRMFTTNSSSVPANDWNWFAIEEVPSYIRSAFVYKMETQTVGNSIFVPVVFGGKLHDDDGFHDPLANSSRLTVPSGRGYTHSRLSFGLVSPSQGGQWIGVVHRTRGGSTDAVAGLPRYETETAGTDSACGLGAWIEVQDGDYFELVVFQNSGGAVTLGMDDGTWFCMEAF